MLESRIKYDPRYPQIESLARELATTGMPADAQVVYSGRNQIYRLMWQGLDVCVKAFKVPGYVNSYAYSFVRQSKALRSYLYAERLLSMGILTPQPYACVEIFSKMRLRQSYYICQYVEADTVRNWQLRADCDAMLASLASEMVRWHALGLWHKDFSGGNVLVRGDMQTGYRFYLVDINRLEFGVHEPKLLMRNFRSIHLVEEETARLARHYARAANLDPQETEREALAQLRRYKRKKNALRIFHPHRPKL